MGSWRWRLRTWVWGADRRLAALHLLAPSTVRAYALADRAGEAYRSGRYEDAERLAAEALAAVGRRTGLPFWLNDILCRCAQERGDWSAVVSRAEGAVALGRRIGDTEMLGTSLHFLGRARFNLGDLVGCRACADELLAITGPAAGTASGMGLMLSGFLARAARDESEARHCFDVARQFFDAAGDEPQSTYAQRWLRRIDVRRTIDGARFAGQWEEVRSCVLELVESGEVSWEEQAILDPVTALGDLCQASARLSELDDARLYAGDADDATRDRAPEERARAACVLGWMASAEDRFEDARAHFQEAIRLARSVGAARTERYANAQLADVALELGDADQARCVAEQVLHDAGGDADGHSIATAQCVLARLERGSGQLDSARMRFDTARGILRAEGIQTEEDGTRIELGLVEVATGNYDVAREHAEAAGPWATLPCTRRTLAELHQLLATQADVQDDHDP